MDKKKTWIIIGLIVIAIIIAFAIYKGIGSAKNTIVTTGGGSTTTKTNGLGDLAGQVLKSIF